LVKHNVGPVERWPQSLLTLVATSIRSRFPIVIWWDRHHYTTFYNNAYIPFLGKTKHPGWLGRSGRDCWREIWPTIGPMLESVFETGQSTWSEDLLLVLDRNLPREEPILPSPIARSRSKWRCGRHLLRLYRDD